VFISTALWAAQSSDTIEFGCYIVAREQIDDSRALTESIAVPCNRQWRAKGDLHRKYHFPDADADHGGMIPLVMPSLFKFFDRCRQANQ
jgi:hypothetical protein